MMAANIQTPTNRSFGIVFSVFFLAVALIPLLHGRDIRFWALWPSIAFAFVAFSKPVILAPLNKLWTRLGIVLNHVVSPVALGVLFFGIVVPTGIILRLLGKDILRLRLNKTVASYWTVRSPPGPNAESFKNQF
jgi:hypothetical protein